MNVRASNAILGQFRLASEIDRFPPHPGAAGRRAETLLKSDGLRVVLITPRAGAALHEHTAPGPITIHALRGGFTVSVSGEERELAEGDLIAVATGIPHAVHARADGAFLLSLGWTPEAAHDREPVDG